MLSLYRTAREAVSIYRDLQQLYAMAVEYTRRPEASPHEVELISDFRNCKPCAYDAEPLLEGDAEPWDSGWSVVFLQKEHSSR